MLEFAIAIMLGIVASLIAQLLWSYSANRIPVIQRYSEFSLSGIYATRFSANIVEGEFIEIVKIKHNGDRINLYLENYNSKRNSIWKDGGNGMCRSSKMVSTFYPLDKKRDHVGVFLLRPISLNDGEILLTGHFSQVIDRPNIELQTFSQRYFLQRIDLPFKRQIKIFFNKTYFKDFNEIRSYLKSRNLWNKINYKFDDKIKFVCED